MASGIPRLQVFATIESVLLHGKAAGRREAARALAEFHGAEANALAVSGPEGPRSARASHIASQLRGRGIPGVLPTLLEMVDSRHAVVRKAARDSLAEFSFRRYLRTFDMLDENVRQSTGMLVKKIDPQTVPRAQGRAAFAGADPPPARHGHRPADRRRGAAGGDHPRAARRRGSHGADRSGGRLGPKRTARRAGMALERALSDRSEGVRHTAQRSLQERAVRALHAESPSALQE